MQNTINNLLQEIKQEAKNINIPVGNIDPCVKINNRTTKRLGMCSKRGNYYYIQISSYILENLEAVKEVLAHEILHTAPDCFNHGNLWKRYGNMMSRRYGYNIARTIDIACYSITQPISQYTIKCQRCGQEIHRQKKSNLVTNTNLYRCGKCKGKLVLM